jgi:hypothetical protein
MVWLDIFLSILVPFLCFGLFALVLVWLAQRTPVSSRALSKAQEMGPPAPRQSIVDAAGNARVEWAVDLEVQRLRHNERRW